MQNNAGYDDGHFNKQSFKKKDVPMKETVNKKTTVQSKP